MEQEPKNSEILEAINGFANQTEQRFDNIEKRLDKSETDINQIKSQMVTKDYLDDKLSDLKGDLVVLIRKEDTKLAALVEILRDKNLIDDTDIKRILAMEPFPKTS